MAESFDLTYYTSVTTITIGLSQNVLFPALRGQNGGVFKQGTTGQVYIVNGISQAATQGYPLSQGEIFQFTGPAQFFFAASGSTATINIAVSYSQGYSNPI